MLARIIFCTLIRVPGRMPGNSQYGRASAHRGLVQTETVGESKGDEARAEDVLHRLSDPQIRGER